MKRGEGMRKVEIEEEEPEEEWPDEWPEEE